MTKPINIGDQDPVVERARALPEALPPSRDLWPDIKHRLSMPAEKRWTTGRLVAAAAILISFSSASTLFIAQMLEAPENLEVATAPPVARFGPWFASGTDIVQTRADMLLSVKDELATLSPETWEIFVINLNNIEAARHQINTALDGYPDSELLQHLLLSTYTDELTLLTRVGSMTRSAQQRIDL